MLPQEIREKRLQNGLTQERLAELLGVATTTIYRWEAGEVGPTPNHVLKLQQIFKLQDASQMPIIDYILSQPRPVAICDSGGMYLHSNDLFRELLGLLQSEVRGLTPGDLFEELTGVMLDGRMTPFERIGKTGASSLELSRVFHKKLSTRFDHKFIPLRQAEFATLIIHEVANSASSCTQATVLWHRG